MPGLENYLALLSRVEQSTSGTAARFAGQIACRPGCDACCRHLSVFAVEAAFLSETLDALPEAEAAEIRAKAGSAAVDVCPLLHDGLCLLYQARPIICRTHGLPLLIDRDGEKGVDFCPENFRELSSIPGDAVIDLEKLNAVLAAVNALYLQSYPGPERVTVAEALER